MSIELLEKRSVFSAETDMHQFLQEVRGVPRLTPEQERDLAKSCAAGDEEAIRALVSANLRLVVSIAREYTGRGVPMLDLIQEGSIGLLAAAKKFDYTLDYRFSTYATKWIRQGITRCLLNHADLIRVPGYTAQQIRKVLSARQLLQVQNGSEPTRQEIAQACGLDVKKVEKLLDLIPEVCSLDAPVGSEEDATLQMLLEDAQTPQPQEELVRRELKDTLDVLLKKMPLRQQQVIRLHYGLEDGVNHSFEQIGRILGVSKERARQIDDQARKRLKRLGKDVGLEDFLG